MKSIILPNHIKKALSIIKEHNGEGYVVGGCVRDILLDTNPHDYDITTSLTPDELILAFKDYEMINNNGIKHGTVSVIINHQVVEITTYRVDKDCDGRHADVCFTRSLLEDVKRRDFTMNAIAYNEEAGIVDLVNGKEDIKNQVIRTVGNPFKRFSEDYLRILRALRFASRLGFKIEAETKKAIHDNYSNLNILSKERILAELKGILIGKYVLDILLEYKDVFSFLIPELLPLIDFDHKSIYHQHDIYTHTAYVVENTNQDFEIRMAALLHDIGKTVVYTEEVKDGIIYRHYKGHPLVSYELAINILARLKVPKKETANILFLVLHHDDNIEATIPDVKKMLKLIPNNPELFLKLLNLKYSDRLDHINLDKLKLTPLEDLNECYQYIIVNKLPFRISELAINGADLMKLGYKGEEIKITLDIILNKIIAEELENTKASIIGFLKKGK